MSKQNTNANPELPDEPGTSVPGFRRELGTRLRETEKRFRNRSEAAEAADVAKSTFQSWVEGKRDPSFEGLAKFASAARVSLDWLAFGCESKTEGLDEEALENAIRAIEERLGKRPAAPEDKAIMIAAVYAEMKKGVK